MGSRSRFILTIVFPALLGVAVPATGLITPRIASWLLVIIAAWLVAMIVTPIEYRFRHAITPLLPIGFQSPVYRKGTSRKVTRASGDLGALDFEQLVLQASARYMKAMARLSAEMARSGAIATKHAPRMAKVTLGSTEAKIGASKRYAKEQRGCVSAMERAATEAAKQGDALRENMLRRLRAFPPDADLSASAPSFAELGSAVRDSRQGTKALRGAVASQRAQGLQQDLNEVCDWQIEVLDAVIREQDAMERYTQEAIAEISQRAAPVLTPRGRPRRPR